MGKRQSASEIEEQAATWIWRLDREGRTPMLLAELDGWLGADTRRRGALLQAEATWMMLDRASQIPVTEDVSSAPAMEPRRWGRRAWFGVGGSIAASIAAAFLFLLQPDARYDTGVGEIRRVQLADGSSVVINTQSAVDFDEKARRRIVRMTHGEAWFKVAKDRTRPFVVEAGSVRVQAVGTAFSVRRRTNGAEILVTEGVVETWVTGAEGHRVRIAAGERGFVADNAAIRTRAAEPTEIDRTLAWRNGKIDLHGETLGWAAAEFNRYNSRDQIVVHPSIAGERLFGVFRTDDPHGFAAAVAISLGDKVSRTADGTIMLSPAN